MATPLEVEMLLHYYCTASDFPNIGSAAQIGAAEKFCQLGLLRRNLTKDEPIYSGNADALSPYVTAICEIEFPKQEWTIPKSTQNNQFPSTKQ